MKFMILVKATKQLAKAGVLVDGSGLQASSKGWRIQYSKNGQRSFVDGPFAETKELVAGYTVIKVKSREEAIQWTKRFPNPSLDSPAVERFRKLEAERHKT